MKQEDDFLRTPTHNPFDSFKNIQSSALSPTGNGGIGIGVGAAIDRDLHLLPDVIVGGTGVEHDRRNILTWIDDEHHRNRHDTSLVGNLVVPNGEGSGRLVDELHASDSVSPLLMQRLGGTNAR